MRKISLSSLSRFRWGSRLWQRIFSLTLLLVLLSQATPFFLMYLEMDNRETRRDRMATFFHDIILKNLNGRPAADAELYLDYFNGLGPQLWFERLDGTTLSGIPVAGLTFTDRLKIQPVSSRWPSINIWEAEGLAWETGPDEPLGLLVAPVEFKDEPAILCYTYWNGRLPHVEAYFYQGVAALVLAGGALSLWMARWVSKPLRRLQMEVLGIGEGNLDTRVTEHGIDEVVDVAKSVNQLTDNLSRHVRGMRELVANISHELRSPLTHMDFATTFIEDGLLEADRQLAQAEKTTRPKLALAFKHLSYLKEELGHMEKLIGTTLLSSKLDLQQQKAEFEPVDLTLLCGDLAANHAPLVASRGLSFTLDIATSIHTLGDNALLRQLLSNLLDNAAKYTARDGRLHLSLQPAPTPTDNPGTTGTMKKLTAETANLPQALLYVENTHKHLSQEALERLFEPFYRAGLATGDGVGLGLSLVQKIAFLHGGEVLAENGILNGADTLRVQARLPLLKL